MLAKLDAPQLPPMTLPRARLIERIVAGVTGRLTLLCAPAGAGKTTLVLSWLASGLAPGPVVWISLDALDRQPGIFWSYLLTGLARAGVSTADVPAPEHPYRLDRSFLTRLSATLYERSQPVVLVLDDADVLSDSPVGAQLDLLLRNAGPGLRLVMLTRGQSAVSLPRHRMAGAVTEVGIGDLAATAAEASALLERQGVPVSAETLDLLLTRTHGWMAGLVLTGLALREGPQPARLAGEHRVGEYLDEYLDEEVLRALSPAVRRFLVRTSVADHLPAGLAEDLAGQPGAARLLAELVDSNAFVTGCDQHADCYRYHPLLQDMLRTRLEYDSPGAIKQLHRRASAWFVAAGEPAEAAVHAAAAGEWRTAARTLVGGFAVAQLLAGPESSRLSWLLADLPADTSGAAAAVVLAAIALARRDAGTCAAELARARELADQVPPAQASALALGTCVVANGLAAATGDAEAALSTSEAAGRLLGEMPETGPLVAARMLVLSNTAGALLQAGRLEAALAVLTEARSLVTPGYEHLRPTCHGMLALVEALRGRLTRAAELAGRSVGPARGEAAAVDHTAAELALAWVAAETGDVALARRHLSAVTPGTTPTPVHAAVLAIVRARVHRAEGDPAAALAVLDAAREVTSGLPALSWLDQRLAAVAAAIRTASGRPELASRGLRELGPATGPELALELARARLAAGEPDPVSGPVADLLRHLDLPLDLRVDALLLRAAAALERGDVTAAKAAADRALRTAAPERLRRPILEAPTRLRGFLRHHADLAARHSWLDEAEPPRRPSPPNRAIEPEAPRSVLIEPLTGKEHEVLVHLAELLSTEDIARRMYVSVNTVRTHVRAILRKLAASRRNEAIRRARDLRII